LSSNQTGKVIDRSTNVVRPYLSTELGDIL
jgi:hypothetical protein